MIDIDVENTQLSAVAALEPCGKHGKIFSPGGMAERLKAHVLKTCLGHTNVGSNPTPSARRFAIDDLQIVNLQAYIELGRCQSGRMGPPAKRLPGRNLRSQVRILSSPLQEKTRPSRNAFLI